VHGTLGEDGHLSGGALGAGERSWIAELLDLERLDGDVFVAREPEGANNDGRLFGGLIAAQSLSAACSTLEDPAKRPQSLHLYFVRGGRPGVDVEMTVERTRDGRSFDTRRVTAVQEGVVILEMLASFHVPEDGADTHPPAERWLSVAEASPVELPPSMGEHFEFRLPGERPHVFDGPPHWIRMITPVEDDPIIRACALTYMSDMGLMMASRPPMTAALPGNFMVASLDHSVWFHRPFVPDHWHRYQTRSLNNNDARGLAIGGFYDTSGVLVASMSQEALWRV
jgi:acyl-CoA thioesterase